MDSGLWSDCISMAWAADGAKAISGITFYPCTVRSRPTFCSANKTGLHSHFGSSVRQRTANKLHSSPCRRLVASLALCSNSLVLAASTVGSLIVGRYIDLFSTPCAAPVSSVASFTPLRLSPTASLGL